MSAQASPQSPPPAGNDGYAYEDRGYGWVVFAGSVLLMAGTINFIEGVAAIGDAHFFVHNTSYLVGSLSSWGWVAVCIAVIQFAAGVGVFAKGQLSRWVGVGILGVNAIAQLLMMPAYPFWSLSIFALDILGMYGLIAHGQRIGDA